VMVAGSIPESLREQEERFAALEELERRAVWERLSTTDQARLDTLRVERARFAESLRKRPAYLAYAAVQYPEEPDPRELPIGPDEVLVRFAVTDGGVYRWVVHQGAVVRLDSIDIDPGDLADAIGELRFALNDPGSDAVVRGDRGGRAHGTPDAAAGVVDLARRLGTLLIDDALAELPPGGSLIVVPDGPLFELPFEALVIDDGEGGEAYLGLTLPVTYAPSARFFAMVRQREQHRRTFDAPLLAIGDPDFSARASADVHALLGAGGAEIKSREEPEPLAGGPSQALAQRSGLLTPIPYTGDEVRAVAACFGDEGTRVLTGHEATRANTLDALASGTHRVVHIATHGVLPSEPICDDEGESCIEQPALVFAGTPGAHFVEQVLTASDIAGLNIPSEMVTLSACDTGSGDRVAGEGVMGMGQAFLYAGTGTVVMSLWPVHDQATASWMQSFYSGYVGSGEPAARALEARQFLAGGGEDGAHPEWAHPYFWAPFIVMGATP
jgi:CHAT domain-containing protein